MNMPQPPPSHQPYVAVADRALPPSVFEDVRLEWLVRQHGPGIAHQLTTMGGDPALAKQATSEAFMEVAKPNHWEKICDGSIRNVRAFVTRFAINKLHNLLRTYFRTTDHEAELTEAHRDRLRGDTPWQEDPERSVEIHETRNMFRVVIPQLYRKSPVQATTVTLHYLGEYAIPEVADILQSNPRTVSSNLRHGVKALRPLVERYDAETGRAGQRVRGRERVSDER